MFALALGAGCASPAAPTPTTGRSLGNPIAVNAPAPAQPVQVAPFGINLSTPAGLIVAVPAVFRALSPAAPIQSVAWSFGDGTTGSGLETRHAYAAEGEYQVTATAVDSLGRVASNESTVDVVPAPILIQGQ
jgi:PKD repeat protein